MDEIIANDKLSYQGKIRARIADEFIKVSCHASQRLS